MPLPLHRTLLVAGLTFVAPALLAQTIQRCESPEGRVSYSNAECPAGTRPVRAVAPAAQPSAEAQSEARALAERQKDEAKALAAQRQPAATPTGPAPSTVSSEDARRAADCAYLRAEIDSNRRLRNVLTTRPYYSLDDVAQMDAREASLAADYRRFCTR